MGFILSCNKITVQYKLLPVTDPCRGETKLKLVRDIINVVSLGAAAGVLVVVAVIALLQLVMLHACVEK